jgi:hypothetical protein
MSRVIRTFLVALLVLALPLQGALATTRAVCAAQHHGGATARAMDTVTGAPAGHAIAVAGAHHHHAGMHSAAPDAGMPAADPQADAGLTGPAADPADDAKCSACAACCAPGAMPAAPHALPVAEPVSTVFASVDAEVEAFASSGPDRPPRSALA